MKDFNRLCKIPPLRNFIMGKDRTIINYRHKRRKFQMALFFLLYLCHNLSIAHGNELSKEKSLSYDLTTAKIREPKDVAPPARFHHDGDEDEDEEDDDEHDNNDYLDLKNSRK